MNPTLYQFLCFRYIQNQKIPIITKVRVSTMDFFHALNKGNNQRKFIKKAAMKERNGFILLSASNGISIWVVKHSFFIV